VSGAHATVMAVTAASVATALRGKKVLQNTPTTAQLRSTTTLRMITRQTSKPRKKLARHLSHANRVNHVNNANHVVNAQSAKNATSALTVPTARHVTHRVKKHSQQRQRPKPLHPKACRISKRSHCLWQRCKPWRKAAVWNGSTPIQTASLPCKPPLQPSQSPCMCHANVHRW